LFFSDASLTMPWNTLDQSAPVVIAHRGASGLRPEHTMEGYALALAQGADVIEPDLVPSADGVLFARHEPNLARSTDIFSRPEFAERQRDGAWHSDDLLAVELDTLRAQQPYPGRSLAFDGQFALPRWTGMIAWAARMAQSRGSPVALYPEIKDPSALARRDSDPVPAFIESVAGLPVDVTVWVQCFEVEPLRRVFAATRLPCALLLNAEADWRAAIKAHASWLARIAVNKRLLRTASGQDAGLVAAAHSAGLRVDAWTFRDDAVGDGYAGIEDELAAAMRLGVDGLFCDFPATALALRNRLQASG
jgi:glycerophosphoryl diester phosphodiesterase